MASEDLAPDSAIISQVEFAESNTANIDDDPDSPDANWALIGGNNANGDIRVSFATPTGNPTTGADFQVIKVEVRQQSTGQSGTPKCSVSIYETGAAESSPLVTTANQDITSESSQVQEHAWDANILVNTNGSAVEAKVIITKSGGGPSARESADIGAIKWVVNYSVGGSKRRMFVN